VDLDSGKPDAEVRRRSEVTSKEPKEGGSVYRRVGRDTTWKSGTIERARAIEAAQETVARVEAGLEAIDQWGKGA
jgi:hypothetical protein